MLLANSFETYLITHNVFVYGKLRFCVQGFSEGKSEASKLVTNFV